MQRCELGYDLTGEVLQACKQWPSQGHCLGGGQVASRESILGGAPPTSTWI